MAKRGRAPTPPPPPKRRVPPAPKQAPAPSRRGAAITAPITRRLAATQEAPHRNSVNAQKGGASKATQAPRADEVKLALKQAIERLGIGAALHGTGSRPSDVQLLGRESQVAQIAQFIVGGAHTTLMLFGMPGTGKTCAVKQAIARVGDSVTALFLNGYVVQRPTDVYRTLYQHLTRHRLGHEDPASMSAEQSATTLEKRFRTQGWSGAAARQASAPKTCVIVVDELDKCIEKNPKVLYRLVEWLTLPHAHCRLIGIANSMEFPLDQKTKSRLDSTSQIVFQPYTEKELMAILQQRLASVLSRFPVMSERAMEYACRQTASQYGDVRRLLQSTASAVHGVLCALDEGEAALPDGEAAAAGLVCFRHVHAVVSRVFQERFRDFVLDTKGALVFLIICVIAVESRRLESQRANHQGSGGGTPSMSLEFLFRQCGHVLEAYQSRLKIPDVASFTRTIFLSHLSALQDVGLVEFGLGGGNEGRDRIPLSSVWASRNLNEDVWVTMTQLPDVVVTMCEVHDRFGTAMQPLLSST